MATRRQVFTAAAHQVLLDNPEMYRNISNLQALRREQAGRWAQRALLLQDPGAGMVERAFMNAGEMDEQIPKLLDTKAKILKPIQEKAMEALKKKVELDDTLAKILIANINAEGQTKASGASALADLGTKQFETAAKTAELQMETWKNGVSSAAPKDQRGVEEVDALYGAALALDAGGGTSDTVAAEELFRGKSPAVVAGLLAKAYETADDRVVENVKGAIAASGMEKGLVSYVANHEANAANFSDTFKTLAVETQLSKGEDDTRTQADMLQQSVKATYVSTTPSRGKQLRQTLDALGDPVIAQQLNDAISQALSPEDEKILDQVDEALKKAQESKELASPTEIREQMRTSAGGVETFQKKLKQAGVEDEKLIGMGAAFRRAARQQARGQVKELEGEGDAAVVSTRRLALSKAEALARKNKAPGWADYSDKPPKGEKPKPDDSRPDAAGDIKLGGSVLPSSGEEEEDIKLGGGVLPSSEPTEGEAVKREEAALGALDAGRAARRSGALNSLRTLLSKPRPVAPSAEPEDEEEVYVDTGPRPRPQGYKWGSGRV
jgi:hypothetical protein